MIRFQICQALLNPLVRNFATVPRGFLVLLAVGCLLSPTLDAAPLVPGTGQKVAGVGDDFEDEKWEYSPNLPKASKETDEMVRLPGGQSKNGLWVEGALRGTPDHVKRVATPPGGIEGSTGAMLVQTLNSGLPRRNSFSPQQDDLLASSRAVNGAVPVSWSPSVVTRVCVPPFDKFERRSGVTFGFRAAVKGIGGPKKPDELDDYWPGIFVRFTPKNNKPESKDTARFVIRAGTNGGDFFGPEITEIGWYTLGMSFTPDGAVHYYIRKGVDDLTSADYVASRNPYGFRARYLNTFFFNALSADNGTSWSTPWIVDDPAMYYNRPQSAVIQQRRR